MVSPHFPARSLVFWVASTASLACCVAAHAQSVPNSLPSGASIPSSAAVSPASVIAAPTAKEAAALDFARGALVSLEDAHAKALAALVPAPPIEELWNDVHLPHVLQERWCAQQDDPSDPLYSPVSPAIWQTRDMAAIHTAPSSILAPLRFSPPYLYFPVPVTDGLDADVSAFDSPHFRLIFPKPENDRIPIPSQKIIEKLEDSLVLMRLMPIHFAKAHPRDVPLKITIRVKYDKTTRSAGISNISSIVVSGESVTVIVSQNHPSVYLTASVCGLTSYLLHPMLVHPVIKTGLEEILLRATPERQSTQDPVRLTAADRKAARLAEREAEKMERELRKLKIPNLVPPVPRTYSFEELIHSLRAFADNKSWNVDSEVSKVLETIIPHQECSQSACDTQMTDSKARVAAAITTAYFLFGDNDGDPVHLQNYFTSLQLLGSNQQAHARLFYGRSTSTITSKICSWAKP